MPWTLPCALVSLAVLQHQQHLWRRLCHSETPAPKASLGATPAPSGRVPSFPWWASSPWRRSDGATSLPSGSGSIHVTAVTSGQDIDADGYLVTLDSGSAVVLPPNGSATFSDIPPGGHELRIAGVATNCTVGGGLRQRVNVADGKTTTIRLTTTCVTRISEIPAATLEVIANTTGIELDLNGYYVRVSNISTGTSNLMFLPVTGSIKVEFTPGSSYLVVLDGVATNCHPTGDASLTRAVTLVASQTTTVTFAIFCEPAYPARLPAGSQLAFVRDGRIHLVNSDGTGVVRLTDGPADCDPAWSPDGARIAFVRGCAGSNVSGVSIIDADGSNLVRRTEGTDIRSPSWSPDGTRIAYSERDFMTGSNVHLLTADSIAQTPVALITSPGVDEQPSWSPDGKTIAFVSDRELYDFVSDLFVLSVADKSIERLTTTVSSSPIGQFYEPAWSRDGSMLAVDKCILEYNVCVVSATLAVMKRDGSGLRELAAIRGLASPSWSPDGRTLAFTVGNNISWIHADGSARGFVIDNGHSPAWRPMPASRTARANGVPRSTTRLPVSQASARNASVGSILSARRKGT